MICKTVTVRVTWVHSLAEKNERQKVKLAERTKKINSRHSRRVKKWGWSINFRFFFFDSHEYYSTLRTSFSSHTLIVAVAEKKIYIFSRFHFDSSSPHLYTNERHKIHEMVTFPKRAVFESLRKLLPYYFVRFFVPIHRLREWLGHFELFVVNVEGRKAKASVRSSMALRSSRNVVELLSPFALDWVAKEGEIFFLHFLYR